MNFTVNIGRAVLGLVCCLAFLALGIGFLVSGIWLAGLIMMLIAVIFCLIFLQNFSCIRFSKDQVERRLFWFSTKKHSWSDVQEVGVVGLRMFRHNKKNAGTKYIYFSPKKMTEQERFQMCLKWPPSQSSGILYLRYSPVRLETVRKYWESDVEQYNIGNLSL